MFPTAQSLLSLPDSPRFLVIPTDQTVTEGQSVDFPCSAEGHPPPVITWTRAGTASLDLWFLSPILPSSTGCGWEQLSCWSRVVTCSGGTGQTVTSTDPVWRCVVDHQGWCSALRKEPLGSLSQGRSVMVFISMKPMESLSLLPAVASDLL